MIGVFIVPTGIEAEIGGHAGDANPAAKLIANCCDKLITHPNVVNASDINEMTENTLYVEGSILDRFLEGNIELAESHQNKILVVCNKPAKNETINAVSAGRATIGIDAEIVELDTPLRMIARIESGIATGDVYGVQELVNQVVEHSFDALAMHTPIEVDREIALNYYRHGGVSPWGGVEAKASRMIADILNKPVAHAPLENVSPDDSELFMIFSEIVDPRISAEAISNCYLHCVLKGLHKAPVVTIFPNMSRKTINRAEVAFLVSPFGCWGRPHKACYKKGIPIIMVKENKTLLDYTPPNDGVIVVENYWEAAGVVMCMKSGVHRMSVRRPLENTAVA